MPLLASGSVCILTLATLLGPHHRLKTIQMTEFSHSTVLYITCNKLVVSPCNHNAHDYFNTENLTIPPEKVSVCTDIHLSALWPFLSLLLAFFRLLHILLYPRFVGSDNIKQH